MSIWGRGFCLERTEDENEGEVGKGESWANSPPTPKSWRVRGGSGSAFPKANGGSSLAPFPF
jgi:hypothetical protein